jgi:hypothetical protein
MNPAMSENLATPGPELPCRLVVTHAAPESFAPMSRAILAKLGYAIVTPEDLAELRKEVEVERPDLRIVDERRLFDVPEDGGPPIPIVVLTGRHGVTGADPRIAGALKRPAGLHELYRLMQQILEDTPRTAPRVPTHLPGVVRRDGKEWKVAVLSLSENGCLIRSPETLLLGSRLELSFDLPASGRLIFDAETAYQLVPDVGLIFNATSPTERQALSGFIESSLIAL